jgi:hypothetical protein
MFPGMNGLPHPDEQDRRRTVVHLEDGRGTVIFHLEYPDRVRALMAAVQVLQLGAACEGTLTLMITPLEE